jgi:hypothetical protein
MSELELRMNQLLQDYRATLGGRLEDYFGTAYLETHHRLAVETALHQTARGNNDYGLDGYCLDETTGNLYLYQFKYSTDWRQFQVSMRRLISVGLAKLFLRTPLDLKENALLQSLRAEIEEFHPEGSHCLHALRVYGQPQESRRIRHAQGLSGAD